MKFHLELPDPPARLPVDDAQPLLTQLASAGYRVPNSCRNGNCELCHAKLLAGAVSVRGEIHNCPGMRIPLCLSLARSDLQLDIHTIETPNRVRVRCEDVQLLTATGDTITLRLPAGRRAPVPTGCTVALLQADKAFTATVVHRQGREWTLRPQAIDARLAAQQPLALLYPLEDSAHHWQLWLATQHGDTVLLSGLGRDPAQAAMHWYSERFPGRGYRCEPESD